MEWHIRPSLKHFEITFRLRYVIILLMVARNTASGLSQSFVTVLDGTQSINKHIDYSNTNNRSIRIGRTLSSTKVNLEEEIVIAPTNPYYDVNGTTLPVEKLTACHLRSRGVHADWSRILNPHPFTNTIAPDSNFCADPDLFLVVYVHTSPYGYKRRSVIRRTWGNPDNYDLKIRVVFVVGLSFMNEQQQALMLEADSYGDILQSDFRDTYRNLTFKAVAGLKWVTTNCGSAPFVLKTDDDVFINMFGLVRHLSAKLKTNKYRQHVLLCNVLWKDPVAREGKWKVAWEECASNRWPPFCQGVAFVLSMDAAIALHNVSYHVPYLWLDDVYITGFLPSAVQDKVKLHEMNSRYMAANHISFSQLRDVLGWKHWWKYLVFHVNDLNAALTAWDDLVKKVKQEIK